MGVGMETDRHLGQVFPPLFFSFFLFLFFFFFLVFSLFFLFSSPSFLFLSVCFPLWSSLPIWPRLPSGFLSISTYLPRTPLFLRGGIEKLWGRKQSVSRVSFVCVYLFPFEVASATGFYIFVFGGW